MSYDFLWKVVEYVRYLLGLTGVPGKFQYVMLLMMVPVFVAEIVKKSKKANSIQNSECGCSQEQHGGKGSHVEEEKQNKEGQKKAAGTKTRNNEKLRLSRL